MVAVEQRLFHSAPAVGIPVHRHHVSEVVSRGVDGPAFPIDQPDVLAAALSRQKEIPHVRVTVNKRQVAARMIAREQSGRLIKQSSVEIAPLGRHHLAEAIGEACEQFCETSQVPVKRICVAPVSYRGAQTRIVPRRGMKASLRLHDALALFQRRRQRPLRGDEMRISQVFEQQMPRAGVRDLHGLETAWHEPARQGRGDVPVERNLVAVRVRRTLRAVEMPHLEDHRTWGLSGRAVVIHA